MPRGHVAIAVLLVRANRRPEHCAGSLVAAAHVQGRHADTVLAADLLVLFDDARCDKGILSRCQDCCDGGDIVVVVVVDT